MFLSDPTTLVVVSGIFGLLIGSFLNVVIHRLPIMMEREWQAQCAELAGNTVPNTEPFSLVTPRSRCPHCGHLIGALENIPVFSYLLQKGSCKGCGKHISLRYPLVEVLTGLTFGYAAWRFGFSLAGAGAMLFLSIMIALTFIDADTQLLPDDLTLPLLWAGLLINLFHTFTTLPNAVVGAAVGYLALWSVYWLFKLATGKEGMGYGDFKLLAAIGAWLGWPMLPLVILLSSLVGAIIGIALIVLAKRGRNVPMPFGPYLAIAGVIALFWGAEINRTYLGLM
jgi:leader peptidase (prepilin peptidase) / N-methyltransferase